MKKAGSSNSKSKTRRISKSSSAKAEEHPVGIPLPSEVRGSASPELTVAEGLVDLGPSLAVGHRPGMELTPQDETLFRAFQNNLLSLISHELRTPLMGILNAVTLLDEEASGVGEAIPGITQAELVTMARQNAQRLHRTLTMLLDLAALESRTFHARLREVELLRMVRGRLDQHRSICRDRDLRIEEVESRETIGLADSQKISRAVDLCLETLLFRAKKGSLVKVRISSEPAPRIGFDFELEPATEKSWELAWMHGMAGFEGGVGSPSSAFAGVLQSEEAFLTRSEEGLGSEFLLIHEIMRLHQGKFEQKRDGSRVSLQLRLPDFSSGEALQAVLTSRAYELSTQATSVALILIQVPKGKELEAFRADLKGLLYRTTDGAYSLPHRREIAIVMDDYRREDLPKFLERIERSLGLTLQASMAHCPDDVIDPSLLFEYAKR